jgi:glutamine synthetase
MSVAGANTVLNTIVAESLDYIAGELETAVKGGKDFNKALQALLSDIIKKHKRIIFNGDGYSEEWHAEAAKRGLPNFKNTVDSIPSLISPESIALFSKYKVLSERELHSRYEIFLENYKKTLNIEGQLTVSIAKTLILPASLRYQGEVATAVKAAKDAGVVVKNQEGLLKSIAGNIEELEGKIEALAAVLDHHAAADALAHATFMRDTVLPAMNAVRKYADALETQVADDLWPLPTYREMLFIK